MGGLIVKMELSKSRWFVIIRMYSLMIYQAYL